MSTRRRLSSLLLASHISLLLLFAVLLLVTGVGTVRTAVMAQARAEAERTVSESRRRLQEWMAAVTLQTLDGYRTMLGAVGFASVTTEDLADEWRTVLRTRLQMFRAMKADTVARLGETRYEEYNRLYTFFVGLIESGKLTGGRFTATR